MRTIWFVVMTLMFALGLVVAGGAIEARCSERGCFGGMCATSAACAPGCHCINNVCG